ncbi:methyl-accepting chemotaxis protein [Caldalkalibacillus mannanilyticus]|uniref:methyl-accepting chemotaxis protein n=1 Tax=Caldalkalibacillus mannanilyticus TaxID=1418 RepID=UPI000468C0C0|nr:methyl-accepting chemotaxis protein [Caldalkalibacillus mannanilyticus]
MPKWRNIKISKRMTILFLLNALVPVIIISLISFTYSSRALESAVNNQLLSIAQVKKGNIENFFNEKQNDIRVLSTISDVKESLPLFTEAFKAEGHKGENYKRIEHRYQSIFDNYITLYDYYDLFLIDLEGNIVYTVVKEADLGTNLNHGPYKSTGLAEAFRQGLTKYTIADYEYYEPSNEPAAFMGYPVVNEHNVKIGVVALQISDGAINSIMKNVAGLGESGETYLVGPNQLMRSDSRFVEESTIGKLKIDTIATREALAGISDTKTIDDYRGVPVLSSYAPLQIEGLQWAIMAEMDEAEAFQSVYAQQITIAGVVIIAIILVIIASILFAKNLVRPINLLRRELNELAERGGDLTKEIQIDTKDEIGELAAATNKFLGNVRSIITDVMQSAKQLSASSEELTEGAQETSMATNVIRESIQDIANGVEIQAKSTEESARAMEEMTLGIQRVAETSSSINESSVALQEKAQDGSEIVTTAVTQINKIQEETINTTHIVELLKKDSEEIEEIVQIISGISAQTNLLALNAAIEAARAGEAGKGFAVVADEIRKLADQTSQSTTKINDLIKEMQNNTQSVVTSINTGKAEVDEGITSIREVGNVFQVMLTSIKEISGQIEEMSAIAEEMSATSEQVTASFEEIASTAQESSQNAQSVASSSEEQMAIVEEITASAESLAQMASELERSVNRFKV